MAELERKFLGHYVDASTTNTPDYEMLGDGIEEMNIEMGANVQKTRDITGKTKTFIDGYEKSQSVEPYKADSNSNMFTRLQEIADENKVLDDLNTTVIDVHLWETPTNNTTYPAIRENAVIELTSIVFNITSFTRVPNVSLFNNLASIVLLSVTSMSSDEP